MGATMFGFLEILVAESGPGDAGLDEEDFAEHQGLVGRAGHLLQSEDDAEQDAMLFEVALPCLARGLPAVQAHVLPCLFSAGLRFVHRLREKGSGGGEGGGWSFRAYCSACTASWSRSRRCPGRPCAPYTTTSRSPQPRTAASCLTAPTPPSRAPLRHSTRPSPISRAKRPPWRCSPGRSRPAGTSTPSAGRSWRTLCSAGPPG